MRIAIACLITACGAHDAPTCAELPPRDCEGAACAELVKLAPARGLGYFDDALAGERTPETSTSYARRDLIMLARYATAKVACTTGAAPLGLGDMSDRDGHVPGTRTGAPRHPPATHEDGRDLDLAYYQLGTLDNRVRAICAHSIAGIDQRHCVAPPTMLDVPRTAALVCALSESPHVRAIGVDGQVGPLLEPAIRARCPGTRVNLAYETIDAGRGWFVAHHNHLHVSWRDEDR